MIFLEPTEDLELVKRIYQTPELFERIKEDGVKPDEFNVEPGALYLLMKTHSEAIAGVAQFEPINNTTLLGHCNVLKDYRLDYAQFVGYALISWFAYDAPEQFHKLQVEIPMTYPDVIGFVKKHGLQFEGLRRQSIQKDGLFIDEWLGGLTRPEAMRWLKQQTHLRLVAEA